MAARVLAEHGWELERAITEVRRVRPGAIERAAQEAIRRFIEMGRSGPAVGYPAVCGRRNARG